MDLNAERAALADDLAAILPGWQIRDHLPEQPRPRMVAIEPADTWVTTRDDLTWTEFIAAWSVRLIVSPGPSSDVLDRLCRAVGDVLAGLTGWTVADVTQPVTLIVNEAAAWPAVSLTVSRIIERN